ncbi:MAG: hypothetical protein IJU57_04670 [Clostridia bacterium]|nr:hypothetical protein [Clostridia bacterium]
MAEYSGEIKTGAENVAPSRLMMLVTVVQKGKGTFFADFLQTFDANLQVCVVGRGTARADAAEFLGLNEKNRTIIFSIVSEDRLDAIMDALESRFYTVNGKTGISFAIPLTSMIGKLSYGFLSNDRRLAKGGEANG